MPSDLQYPVEGVDSTRAFSRQRQGTTPGAQNVRAFDPGTDRARGGSRAGMDKQFSYQVVGDYPIQNICQLVTNDVSEPAVSKGQFTYGVTTTTPGFGLGSSAGASITTTTVASFNFACSCWDDYGNGYAALVNTSANPATTKIYKFNTSGTIASGWPVTGISVTTGSVRALCGMVVIEPYLYIACTQGGLSRIHKITTGNPVPDWWTFGQTTSGILTSNYVTSTTISTMVFSTAAVNCLGKVGTLLGVECRASSTLQCFKIFDGKKTTATQLTSTAYGGTGAANRSTVCSDGLNFFYAITSVSASMIKCIDKAGKVVWSTSAADTPNGLCFDFTNAMLVAVIPSTPSVRQLSLSAGSLVASADPGSKTTWNWIDCDNSGFFTLYDDAVGSNDIMGVNTSFTTVWGPTTFDNTTHSGAAVNKGQTVQTTGSGDRQIRKLSVSNGECRRLTSTSMGDVTTASNTLTGGQSFSLIAPTVFSFQLGQDMYFVDGTSYYFYKSTTDAVTQLVATSGSLPVDSHRSAARLGCAWNRRMVLAGLPRDPGNWFMSAVNAPTNWNYSPTITVATQAVSGNTSDPGTIEDRINGLIPYTDDTLIFLCDHSIWQMTGDPMAGGSLDAISHTVGGAFGLAWAIDPVGQIYFFSTSGTIFKMTPGSVPTPLSQSIKRDLQQIDLSQNVITLAWDVKNQGLGVWVTPIRADRRGQCWFYEDRVSAWWPDFYEDKNFYPNALCVFDGDAPGDRAIWLGGRDGYIRTLLNDAATDDGEDIESYIFIPVMARDMADMLIKDLQATLGGYSGDVTYEVFSGHSAEEAYNAALASVGKKAVDPTGTWTAGRNDVSLVYASGISHIVKVGGTNKWALERISMTTQTYRGSRRKMTL